MAHGTVKWFNTAKRFGFIKPDHPGSDIFVHISALEAAGITKLSDGQRVSYDTETSKGKESAVNLKVI